MRFIVKNSFAALICAITFIVAASLCFPLKSTAMKSVPVLEAIHEYIALGPEKRDRFKCTHHFDEFTKAELERLIEKFGVLNVKQAIDRFPDADSDRLIRTNGLDYYLMFIHTVLASKDYILFLDTAFNVNHRYLLKSAQDNKGRFIGALIIFETIEFEKFSAIINVFLTNLKSNTFLESFYKDPYLLASAIRILAQRDPKGENLKTFLSYFPNDQLRSQLFSNDLPGLVVAFSTVQEIKTGETRPWVNSFFEMNDKELALLIHKKPVQSAYVLYGGHQIGIDNFKQVFKGVEQEVLKAGFIAHTDWFANFIVGLKKINLLSSDADLSRADVSTSNIKTHYPFLLQYNSYLPGNIEHVMTLFQNLPEKSDFLYSKDKDLIIRVYLLGLMAVYQNILYDFMPSAVLSLEQFELLKLQILLSTRVSENLDTMVSNFEIGKSALKGREMETIILSLAHELAHQIYSIRGFNSISLPGHSIHEFGADIAALCMAQKLGYCLGMEEYKQKVMNRDDFSRHRKVDGGLLTAIDASHKIGRTQLGYVVKGFDKVGIIINWELFFPITLRLLENRTEIELLQFIYQLVSGYAYGSAAGYKNEDELEHVLRKAEKRFDHHRISNRIETYLANADTIEQILKAGGNRTVKKGI